MTGETLALAAALAYGAAGVAIVRGRASARGDNGVLVSVVLTASFSGALWLGWGRVGLDTLGAGSAAPALAAFVLAGLFSNVLGRTAMYRATERIGAVGAGLLRRLTPVFAIPAAVLLLGEWPALPVLAGGALVLAGVFFYLHTPAGRIAGLPASGILLGAGSALAYALAYAFRGAGLGPLPDPALGAFMGALAACAWFALAALIGRGGGFHAPDLGPWQLLAALLLSAGQILQFFALGAASVATVAVIGALDVLFSALIVLALRTGEPVALSRLPAALALAAAGTALIVLA